MDQTRTKTAPPGGTGDPVRAQGRWPVVNLEVVEDFVDEPTVTMSGEGTQGKRENGEGTTKSERCLLRIHTDIPLTKDQYRRIHKALEDKNHQGAFQILTDEGALAGGTERGLNLVRVALRRR